MTKVSQLCDRIIRLPQEQWDKVFGYCFGLVFALGYMAIMAWAGWSWWLEAIIVNHILWKWYRNA